MSTHHDTTNAPAPAAIDLVHELDIDAPAGTVWSVVADYTQDPRWRTGVQVMTCDAGGLVQEGAVTDETLRLGGRTYRNLGEVTSVGPGLAFTWRTFDGADADGARSVEPLGPGRCRLRLELRVRPHGPERLLVPMYRKLLAKNLAADGEALRRLVTEEGPRPIATTT